MHRFISVDGGLSVSSSANSQVISSLNIICLSYCDKYFAKAATLLLFI